MRLFATPRSMKKDHMADEAIFIGEKTLPLQIFHLVKNHLSFLLSQESIFALVDARLRGHDNLKVQT